MESPVALLQSGLKVARICNVYPQRMIALSGQRRLDLT